MEHTFFHRLSNGLWVAIVTLVIALALYVSFGRLFMSVVGGHGDEILGELNSRLPFKVEATEVRGEWHAFTPEIVLKELRLSLPEAGSQPVELGEGRLSLDAWESFKTRSLQVSRLALGDLLVRGELAADGTLSIAGFGGGGGTMDAWLKQLLGNIQQLDLSENTLVLTVPGGQTRELGLDLTLSRQGSTRKLQGNLVSRTTGTEMAVLAEGTGDPFDPARFNGDLYLDFRLRDLAALRELLPADLNLQMGGELDLEVWLGWHRGQSTIEARVDGRELEFADAAGSWSVPMDSAAMELAAVEHKGRWRFFASDVELQRENVELVVPRVQFEASGDTLLARVEALSLEPANALFVTHPRSPRALADVFRVLAPRGQLSAGQLRVEDYRAAGANWSLKARFDDLEVDSWKGAPGVRSGSGYAELGPGGGYVVLDSHQFSMDFPTVYLNPLRFDEFYGLIGIDWDSQDLTLSSSLVVAEGVEGRAHAIFGLSIPLVESPVGLEMDLLVGLQDSHPIHRTKYLPYSLNETLLDWLQSSIGEGSVKQGAFLWRGSLRSEASDLRTVQLFFNVDNTRLNYHPQWPPLTDLTGTVLIDDSNVSVWSEEAQLYDTEVSFLSAEAWVRGKNMILDISGAMEGPARDGLAVLNESPLTALIGTAFDQWQLDGVLQTQLQLQLDLNDAAVPPVVEVDTVWQGVSVGINPGQLQLESVSGDLAYSTQRGFRSQGLVGEVWGRPLKAELRQSAGDYDAAKTVVEVDIESRVDMADIQKWLGLDYLAFAQGETQAQVVITVPPREAPRVAVHSTLEGVELDLPSPWYKSTERPAALSLQAPLAGGERVVALNVDQELYLNVLFHDDRYQGVAVGLQRPPARIEAGSIRIEGHAPVLDGGSWEHFLNQYFFPPAEGSGAVEAEVEPAQALSVIMDEVEADSLTLLGQDLRNVVVSLDKNNRQWNLFVEGDWLRGSLVLDESLSHGRLHLDHLDMSGLNAFGGGEGEARELSLPDLEVKVASLLREGVDLGHLDFALKNEGDLLRVEGLSGRLAGLTLAPDSPASLVWDQHEEAPQTRFEGQFVFGDLGETLETLGYERVVQSREGQIDLDLNWPGGPEVFSLESAAGQLQLSLGEGSFPNTPAGASGTLRVVGILNLADILRRLSLDLSDMFAKGIPFHSVDGALSLDDGTIEVATLNVQGRSSSFQFSGSSSVAEETLDGRLVVTLPVANNLPWVAALAAGLPIAAGVFVVSKVFEKQVNRFSSAVYSIEGSWDDPQLNFERIFNNKSTKAPIAASEPPAEPVVPSGAP